MALKDWLRTASGDPEVNRFTLWDMLLFLVSYFWIKEKSELAKTSRARGRVQAHSVSEYTRGPAPAKKVDEKSATTELKERPRVLLNRNQRSRRRTRKPNYYTNRKALSLPVIRFPNLNVKLNDNPEENLRIAIARLRLIGKEKSPKKGTSPEDGEALKNPGKIIRKTVSEAQVERLKRKRMEGISGNSSGQGKFSKNDDHQSAAVNVRERKFPDDKKRVCSSAECKTFLGEANRNRKSKDLRNSEKSDALKPETTEKYLQDSYSNAFQRHVDNLTNVISQYRNSSAADKTKAEVHIHPTENSKNLRNVLPKPLSKLEIKNEAGVNQKITFSQEEEDEEEFEDTSKMSPLKGLKTVNVLTEKLEEENLFEELIEPHPMITFNHVCSEASADQVSFTQIKSGSRSPSPMLEVPASKTAQKMASRPPL